IAVGRSNPPKVYLGAIDISRVMAPDSRKIKFSLSPLRYILGNFMIALILRNNGLISIRDFCDCINQASFLKIIMVKLDYFKAIFFRNSFVLMLLITASSSLLCPAHLQAKEASEVVSTQRRIKVKGQIVDEQTGTK